MASEAAMDALMSIEGFRSLNTEINDIIIASEKVRKAKAKGEKLTPKEKKELSAEEKEYKSKRKLIQEKLIKFATRIPVFMYLTDFREYSLRDVITQLEPGLFKRVTGLDVKDFELLVSLGVFNGALMNDAVYKFKRYEDSSLNYTGVDRHEGLAVGGYDTVLTREEFERLFGAQQISVFETAQTSDDLPEIDKATTVPITRQKTTTVIPLPRPQKPTIDLSNVRVGESVKHKAFGDGIVIELTADRIFIMFGKVEKVFLFPTAFENGFLSVGE